MDLIFIHGPAASGKLTVGRELQSLTGFRLFHNHLVVDTLLAVFPFGTSPFIRLRERIWLDVFSEAAKQRTSLIFTFTPEPTVSVGFPHAAKETVGQHGGITRFVEPVCPVDELEKRIENPSRAQFQKLRSVETLRAIRKSQKGKSCPLPPSDLVVDSSTSCPADAARRIREAFSLPLANASAKYIPYPPAGEAK